MQAVHKIYNKYEVEPANLAATMVLLVWVPSLPSHFIMPHMNSVVSAILSSYAIFYASLSLSVALYRVSLMHPLSRYPGPFSMKISKLVWTYYASTGKQYRLFKELHAKYGDVVRIGTTTP